MKIKRVFLILLALLMVASVAVACKPGSGNDDPDNPSGRKNKWGGVPDGKIYDGYEFVISTYVEGNIGVGWSNYFDVDDPEEGELMQNAANRRNNAIEADFKCEITCTEDWRWSESYVFVSTKILSGDDDVNVYYTDPTANKASFVIDQVLYDVSTLPYITWDADYYNQQMNETFMLGSKQYIFASDMSYPCQSSTVFLVNKDELVNHNYASDYIYTLVDSGEWVFDKLFEMVEGLYVDLDHDQTYSENDYYGFSADPYGMVYEYPGAGLKGTYLTDSGFEFDFGTTRAVSVVDKICDFLQKPEVWCKEWGKRPVMFFAGNSLFCSWASELRGLNVIDFNFGVVPFPKFDDTQDRYYSYTGGGLMFVPSTVADPDFTGALIEAMSVGSHSELVPAFYEKYIQQRVLQDEKSREYWAKMLTEWSLPEFTREFSPNEYVTTYGPAFKAIDSVANGGVNNFVSKWNAMSELVDEECQAFYDKFMKKV
ncbi:MAG: hypothetical protein IKX86_02775 [Clostridia bacterium]|nr:hypothetical protein [Clostridia bacterium]